MALRGGVYLWEQTQARVKPARHVEARLDRRHDRLDPAALQHSARVRHADHQGPRSALHGLLQTQVW